MYLMSEMTGNRLVKGKGKEGGQCDRRHWFGAKGEAAQGSGGRP